jgi:hypothetical protein
MAIAYRWFDLFRPFLGQRQAGSVSLHEQQQSPWFMRSDNFFKMLRLTSCMARRGATATPDTRFGFREVVSMAEGRLFFAFEFILKSLWFLNEGS